MANARVIRTFSMIGADGAGKTALVEALWRIADPKRTPAEATTSRLDARRASRTTGARSTSSTAPASPRSSPRSSGRSR